MQTEIQRTEYSTKCFHAALDAAEAVGGIDCEWASGVEKLNHRRAAAAFKRLDKFMGLANYEVEHIVATVVWVLNNPAFDEDQKRDAHPYAAGSQWLIGFALGFASHRLAPP